MEGEKNRDEGVPEQRRQDVQGSHEDLRDRVQLCLAGAWRGVGGRQELGRAEAQGAEAGRS